MLREKEREFQCVAKYEKSNVTAEKGKEGEEPIYKKMAITSTKEHGRSSSVLRRENSFRAQGKVEVRRGENPPSKRRKCS